MRINPVSVRLDASTACQLKCPTCPTAKGEIARELGTELLKFRDFKRFVDANPWVKSIELSSWGEIFLNPDLLAIAAYAHEKKVALNAATGTNLNTASEAMLEGLVQYRFGRITCSIDGASQDTYGIYRKGGDFNQVMAHIKTINAHKARYKSIFPKLCWQFIAFGHNEHEIPLARRMARALDMDFFVKLSWDEFSPLKNPALIRRLSGTGAVNRREYQDKYGRIYQAEKICSQLWLQPQINTDGRVLGCSVNYWADYGNAFEDDLKGILNNEKMNYARAMLRGKKPERKDIPCAQCQWYKKMQESGSWLFSRRSP